MAPPPPPPCMNQRHCAGWGRFCRSLSATTVSEVLLRRIYGSGPRPDLAPIWFFSICFMPPSVKRNLWHQFLVVHFVQLFQELLCQ